MNLPFFSVVIITYNRPLFVKKAIESVVSQTFIDFEILVVNDGSQVDYSDIEEYVKAFSFIKYFFDIFILYLFSELLVM